MYHIGSGKAFITYFEKDVGFLGYGMPHNIAKSVGTPLHARAFSFKHQKPDGSERKIVFVNAEICFITSALKYSVLKKLSELLPGEYSSSNLLMTAQHTHSAPGGYSHYFFYNILVSGFKPKVLQAYTNGIVEAIIKADQSAQPARIKLQRGSFPETTEVAFNRSLKAYNANPETDGHTFTKEDAHLALDREMKLLRFETPEGKALGSINWFGVHTTSISNDNTKINYDNKGYASQFMETYLNSLNPSEEPIVSIFAQDACGDVSPNFIWDKKKKWTRGKFEDDIESAQFNGMLQFQQARKLFDDAAYGKDIEGGLDYLTMYVDLSNVKIDEDFCGGLKNQRTAGASLGVSFLEGTKEGPGASKFAGNLMRAGFWFVKTYHQTLYRAFIPYKTRVRLMNHYEMQSPKSIMLDMGSGRILGTKRVNNLIVPAAADPFVAYFKMLYKKGILDHTPWLHKVQPLQIVIMGNLALLCIPAEITTIAAQRLVKVVADVLRERGVTDVICSPYANAYSGYITTHEEYQKQCYEGGHTLFGKWTCAAYQTKYRELAKEMLKPREERLKEQEDRLYKPDLLSEDELWMGFKKDGEKMIIK